LTLITAQVSYADGPGEKKPKDISKYERVVVGLETIVVDKQLLDIYVRMMRYQTAGQDIANHMSGSAARMEDYLTIAVNNMRIGKKSELSSYLKELYRQRSNEILQIQRNESCPEGEACRVSYEVEWMDNPAGDEQLSYPSMKNVEEYISYDVTVRYKGKSLTHAGLILYYKSEKPEGEFFVFDGIIPQINVASLDRLPAAKTRGRSAKTFGQPRREEAKELKPAKVWESAVEPEDEGMPIGYLPGEIEDGFMTTMSAACTVPGPTNFPWFDETAEINAVSDAVNLAINRLSRSECDTALAAQYGIPSLRALFTSDAIKLATSDNPTSYNTYDARTSRYIYQTGQPPISEYFSSHSGLAANSPWLK